MNSPSSAVLCMLLGIAYLVAPLQADASRHRPHAHRRARDLVAWHQHTHHGAEVRAVRHSQHGIASVYAERFRGRKMADGTRFDPISNAAASKSLPLGTTAQVTNLRNGRTATIQVRDRGPYRRGRIIDVSPGSASTLGMDRHSTAPVTVSPMARPATR